MISFPMRSLRRARQNSRRLAAIALCAGLASGIGQRADAQSYTVRIALAPNPPTMTLLSVAVAEAQGYFTKYGVTLNTIVVDSSNTVLRGLVAGQVDVGITAAVGQIPAVANGSDVKQFYGLTQLIQHQYLVPESIKSCSDLRGKAVAIDTNGGFVETLTRAFLATCGLTPNDVKYAANLGGAAGVQAMVAGQVYGMAYPPEAAQTYILRFADKKLHVIGDFSKIDPNEAGQGLGATTKTLADDKDALVHFTAALIEANAFINNTANKQRVVDIAQTFTKAKNKEPLELAYDSYIADKIFPGAGQNGLPENRFDFTTKRLEKAGFFPADKAPTYSQLVDGSIFTQAEDLVASKKN